ncbi:MAG: molybdenum cofactor guanylyltransferase [Armatimonadota bacterium]
MIENASQLQRWPHTGAIFAGGRSERMREPKEGVRLWDGRPMIAHVIEALQTTCRKVVIIGGGDQLTPDIQVLPDLHPGLGPLAGLETLLASSLDDCYLVVSCDQPLLTPELLSRLTTHCASGACFFRTESGQGLHPFPGIFPAEWLPQVQGALQRGTLSIRRLIEELPVSWVVLPDALHPQLKSMNTPEDIQKLNAAGGVSG